MKIGILAERLIKGYGVDLVIHNQANGLAAAGHEVTIYVQRHEKGFFKKQNYSVVEIDSPLLFNPLKTEWKLLRRKIKFFRREPNDIWLVHTWPFFVLIPFLKGKVIVNDHGTVSAEGMYLKRKLVFWYQKYMSKYLYFLFANKILSISKYIKNTLPIHVRWKSKVIYNGADQYTKDYVAKQEKVQKYRASIGVDDSQVMILSVGRLNHGAQPYKGVADLVDIYTQAKKRNDTIQLVMAGYGSDEDVDELAKHDIIARRSVDEDELLTLFDACDFYASATKWEGFNLPMVEAQSFGKIPVVYDIGPHNEILNHKTDSFVVKNQAEFIDTVLRLAKDTTLRTDMAQAAKENAARYTWEKSINALTTFITKFES